MKLSLGCDDDDADTNEAVAAVAAAADSCRCYWAPVAASFWQTNGWTNEETTRRACCV